MEVVVINGQKRELNGTKGASDVRRAGLVPCVMYGSGDPIAFSADPKEVKNIVYTPKFKMAEVKLDGKTHKCILKDLQFHPTKDTVQHLDFLMLVPGKKFKAEVPIRWDGASIGVKNGGKFLALVRKVKIAATPETIVDEVGADISAMELGGTIRVRDIKLTPGVDILNAGAIPVAIVEIPRALRGAKS